jgi:hypothetical protein
VLTDTWGFTNLLHIVIVQTYIYLESRVLILLLFWIRGILIRQTKLNLLDLQGQNAREAASLEEITSLEPESWNTTISPNCLDFSLLVEGPACVHLVGCVFANDPPDGVY